MRCITAQMRRWAKSKGMPRNYGHTQGAKNVELICEEAYKMGIKTKLEEIASLPLGTTELNIIEITNAYATLASNGIKTEPYLISKVTDMNDNVIYEHKDKSMQVLDEDYVYILNNMLSLTYDYDMVDYSYPTNISIRALLSHKYGIKSGSTDTDNWVIGFNPNAVMSIWVGYDDNTPLLVDDYKYVKKIWANTMEGYLKNTENQWYEKPENIVGVFVDPISGNLPTEKTKKKKLFYYLIGTEPTNIETVIKENKEKKD